MQNYTKTISKMLNFLSMTLCLLLSLIAFSVGLMFYFLVISRVGMIVGILMFVVAGLIFLIGEVSYFKNMAMLKKAE